MPATPASTTTFFWNVSMNLINEMQEGPHVSARQSELIALLNQDAGMRGRRLDLLADDVEPSMQDYSFSVSAWPVIISQAHIRQFNGLVARLPKLIAKAVRCMFPEDAAGFSAYLHESMLLHGILLGADIDFRQMMNRHDMIYVNGDLKLVEVNAGSTIGGWQPGLLENKMRQIWQEYPATAQWNLHHRNVLDAMFGVVSASMLRLKKHRAVGNILMPMPEQPEWRQVLQGVFAKSVPAALKGGKVHFFSDVSEITFSPAGAVYFAGHRMDAALLPSMPADTMMRLTTAHLAGHIVLPDSLLYTFFGNKMLMALLHEPALQQHLSEEERAFIRRHVPFTMTMKARTLAWGGTSWELGELLSTHKDGFVIKKSHSLSGRDVFVGKYLDQTRWNAIVAEHVDMDDWLAQEYCGADVVHVPDMQGNVCEHTVVWGIFDTGGTYGGAFVRAMAHGQGLGVVNSKNGAVEFAVFEEVARKNKISI